MAGLAPPDFKADFRAVGVKGHSLHTPRRNELQMDRGPKCKMQGKHFSNLSENTGEDLADAQHGHDVQDTTLKQSRGRNH